MAYVLDIRGPEQGADGEEVVARLRDGLAKDGTVEDEEEGFVLVEGGTRLHLRRTRDEAGKVDGVDLEIPYGAVAEEVGRALDLVLSQAAGDGDRIFDPQLGRGVSAADAGAILSSFLSASSYQVEYAGRIEDSRAGEAHPAPVTRKASTQLKVVLALVALLVGVYLAFQACVVAPMGRALQGVAPKHAQTGPPRGWMAGHPTTLAPGSVKVPEADGGR